MKYSAFAPAAALCASLALTVPSTGSLAAAEPPGVRDLLKTAIAAEDRETFDRILKLALETWPGDKTDIFKLVEELRADWMTADQVEVLADYREAVAAAEKKERDRGIWYYTDPKYWNPKLELGAGTASGDTSEQSIALGFSINRDFDKWSHKFDARLDYAERQSVVTRDRLDFIQESSWNVFQKGFVNNFTQVEFDRFSGFDWRVTEVIGVAYQLLESDKQKLRITAGPGFRFSRVEEAIEGDVITPAFTRQEVIGRFGANYSLKLGDGITFEETAAGVLGTSSFRLDNSAILSAQINSSLAARLRFDVVYETDVPVGTSEIDTVTRATIVYTF